jgi:lipid II:glycine glycyltransferase (peptidoglycan interpeptide bridge formation enzyme)
MSEISNYDDVIDSRDINSRYEMLLSEFDDLNSAIEDAIQDYGEESDEVEEAEEDKQNWIDDYQEEMDMLENIIDRGRQLSSSWNYGATLVRNCYFTTYARELAEEMTDISNNTWPFNHIDWEAAADALKMDYNEIEFDGVIYWVAD